MLAIIPYPKEFFIILAASIILSFIVTLIYKYTTDQKEMKRIKDQMKEFQKEMREHKNDQKKMMEINSEMMKINTTYMSKSMRSSFFTIVPAMGIFYLLMGMVAFLPIMPASTFTMTATLNSGYNASSLHITMPQGFTLLNTTVKRQTVTFEIKAPNTTGNYTLNMKYANDTFPVSVAVSPTHREKATSKFSHGALRNAKINYNQRSIVQLPFWPHRLNWLWTYLIMAVIFGSLTRRILKVH